MPVTVLNVVNIKGEMRSPNAKMPSSSEVQSGKRMSPNSVSGSTIGRIRSDVNCLKARTVIRAH